jgi:alpha-ketoglutaric semialdehyde dehydrogenase
MHVKIHNPANPSEIVGSFPTITPDHVPAIVASARAAQRAWAKVPQPERGKLIDDFLDGLERYRNRNNARNG